MKLPRYKITMKKVCPDLYEIVEVVVEKNSGHCRPSKVLRCVCCGDSLLLVVCLVITRLGGVRDTKHVREHSNASSALEGRYKCW